MKPELFAFVTLSTTLLNVEGSALITNIVQSPTAPNSTNAVTIQAKVTDDSGLDSVTLTYNTGASGTLTNTVFLETMATNAIKPWPGTGCNNSWFLTCSGGNPFEQSVNGNYGAGAPCGLQFKQGNASLTNNMLTATAAINATGAAAFAEFYLRRL